MSKSKKGKRFLFSAEEMAAAFEYVNYAADGDPLLASRLLNAIYGMTPSKVSEAIHVSIGIGEKQETFDLKGSDKLKIKRLARICRLVGLKKFEVVKHDSSIFFSEKK